MRDEDKKKKGSVACNMTMTGMRMDLSGVWEFRLDAAKEGIRQKYYGRTLEDKIVLPTTTAKAHKGIHGDAKETGYLTEPYHFEGYAWFARTLEIPEEHIGDLAQLVIERTRVSYVWVDADFVGTQDSFAAAHRYDLTAYLTKSCHRLTVMVSNVDYKTGGGHMTSPDTQTNWNGMLGQIALILEPAVRVENLWVDAKACRRSVEVRFTAACRKSRIDESDIRVIKAESDRANGAGHRDGKCVGNRTVTAYCMVQRCSVNRESGDAGQENREGAEIDKERNNEAGAAMRVGETLLQVCKKIVLHPEETEYTWQMEIPEGQKIALWNEFTPNLYEVTVEIVDSPDGFIPECGDTRNLLQNGRAQNRSEADGRQTILGSVSTVIGFRDLHTGAEPEAEKQSPQSGEAQFIFLNDLPVMLRGKHDGMIFPMTGYAPMDKEAWRKVFGTAKEYGINHYRFHTCCPPEAAFAAADEMGIYLAPELPFWGTVAGEEETERDREGRAWLLEEGFRILREFGNHPSFVIFSLGNELWGDQKVLNDILGQYKAADRRHLYVQGSNNFQFCPVILENDDLFNGVRFARERLFRGSYAMCDAPQGHIQTQMPDNCHSYDEAIRLGQKAGDAVIGEDWEAQQITSETGEVEIQFGTSTKKVKTTESAELIPHVPVISHEIGQYEFYPDYDEIGRYTGVLQPENLKIFRERLAAKGMLHMAKHFFHAAGRLAAECYKRELETAFRSRELAGFQLLDLQDFTGQGTALVGILNAFMENKGLISAEEWREFCNDRVVMLSFPTYVYETGGTFDYEVLVCNMRPDTEMSQKEEGGKGKVNAAAKGCGDGASGAHTAKDGWMKNADEEKECAKPTGVRITVELIERDSGRVLAQRVHEGLLRLIRLVSFGDGSISIPAGDDPMRLRVVVTVSACGSEQILMKNHYDLYAYPAADKKQPAGQISVAVRKQSAGQISAAVRKQSAGQIPVTVTDDTRRMLECLRAGERVLFFGNGIGEAYSMEGTYCTDFWCYPMFASISESMGKPLPIGTMGLYMDREHPIFAKFPTEGFTTPQWWRIVTGSRVAVLDDQPVEPLVWMIDHFSRNHKLGLVYEAKVGAGSLLVCQADLLSQDSLEVNRFYDSLLAYAESGHFMPQAQIGEAWLEKVYG